MLVLVIFTVNKIIDFLYPIKELVNVKVVPITMIFY